MGLQDVFKEAAQTAFTVADDIRETVTYRAMINATQTYDPTVGTVTQTEDTDFTDYSVKVISTKHKYIQQPNTVMLAGDDMLMIPVDNLSPTPKLHDQILRVSEAEIWDIVDFFTDAAQALWVFHIRKL